MSSAPAAGSDAGAVAGALAFLRPLLPGLPLARISPPKAHAADVELADAGAAAEARVAAGGLAAPAAPPPAVATPSPVRAGRPAVRQDSPPAAPRSTAAVAALAASDSVYVGHELIVRVESEAAAAAAAQGRVSTGRPPHAPTTGHSRQSLELEAHSAGGLAGGPAAAGAAGARRPSAVGAAGAGAAAGVGVGVGGPGSKDTGEPPAPRGWSRAQKGWLAALLLLLLAAVAVGVGVGVSQATKGGGSSSASLSGGTAGAAAAVSPPPPPTAVQQLPAPQPSPGPPAPPPVLASPPPPVAASPPRSPLPPPSSPPPPLAVVLPPPAVSPPPPSPSPPPPAPSPPPPAGPAWLPAGAVSLLEDGFSQGVLDSFVWEYENEPPLSQRDAAQLQTYTSSQDNVAVGGPPAEGEDVLYLRALSENGTYTSGRLNSAPNGGWYPGMALDGGGTAATIHVEARLQLPEPGQGLWPAFWLAPVDDSYGAWPASGEIDIMMSRGDMAAITQAIHFGPPWPSNAQSEVSTVQPGQQPWSGGWHTYACDWSRDTIVMSIDGSEMARFYSRAVNQTGGWYTPGGASPQAPFDRPFSVVLNVAVGGTWAGPPDDSTPFPATMAVHYVHAWALPNP